MIVLILIACLDDRGGMLFNKRRQSRDAILLEDLLREVGNRDLWISEFSASLFNSSAAALHIDEQFLDRAASGEYCFVENRAVKKYEKQIEALLIYRWNRSYPGDFFFDLPLGGAAWHCIKTEEFPGNSHEKITKEYYIK